MTASISGLSHSFPDDVDILLVGPTGVKTILMSDVGGGPPGVSGVNATFDDAAANALPDGSAFASGTYKPTAGTTGVGAGCHVPASFPSPAPAGPYGTALSAFNGTNPTGTWNLYVIDDTLGDTGTISGGWSLTITTGTGTITVTKHLISNSFDPAKFNLRIDGTTYAANVGDGGTTGAITVQSGTHTVSETAGVNADLSKYTARIDCSDGSAGYGTSLSGITVNTGDNVTCTITNTRKLFKVG